MELFPPLKLGLFNGWLLILTFWGIFGLTLRTYSPEGRAQLFDRSGWNERQKRISAIGRPFTLVNIILIIFTPLKIGEPVFFIGLTLFLLGLFIVVSALVTYRDTPQGEPVTGGLYRYSRNPQWVGIFLVLLSGAIAIGSWTCVFIVFIVAVSYHFRILGEEQACLAQYGASYEAHLQKIPRYFLFF